MNHSNNKNINEAYEAYLMPMKVQSARLFTVLGSFLYLSFIIADFYALPEMFLEALFVRVSVVLFLGITYFLTYKQHFIKYYDVISATIALSASLGIIFMIYVSSPSDHASKVYFVGVIMVIMSLLGWSFMQPLTSWVTFTTITVSYVVVSILKGMPTTNLIVNLLFFIGAISIGVISQILRDYFLRELFELKEIMAESLKEKTVESNNNAFLANHDPLTGLPNRRYMMSQLEELLCKAKADEKAMALLFIDLDGFKQINDVYGHDIGDEVLKIVAQRLSLTIDRCDCLSRLGGDEFLIGIIFDKEYLSRLDNILDRYKSSVSQAMKIGGKDLHVGASIGVATYPSDGDTITSLMKLADKKMYEVKYKEKAVSGSPEKHLPITLQINS